MIPRKDSISVREVKKEKNHISSTYRKQRENWKWDKAINIQNLTQ